MQVLLTYYTLPKLHNANVPQESLSFWLTENTQTDPGFVILSYVADKHILCLIHIEFGWTKIKLIWTYNKFIGQIAYLIAH